MGTARPLGARKKTESPLASAQVAKARLRAFQKKIGRTQVEADVIDACLLDVVRAYTGGTFVLNNPSFLKFQQALVLAVDALAEFDPVELSDDLGNEQVMSLGLAKAQLDALYEFFVYRTPTDGPFNDWSANYSMWNEPKSRSLLKSDPRKAATMHVLEQLRTKVPNGCAEPKATELMLAAAIHELPGEEFIGSSSHYQKTLDNWRKALTRAKRTKPQKK